MPLIATAPQWLFCHYCLRRLSMTAQQAGLDSPLDGYVLCNECVRVLRPEDWRKHRPQRKEVQP